ncbi:Hpt domain-containing response regulator [Terriglobus roseus]|uniref:Hpt domain-containing protein n=1 Tax=Terriglobus roseus TaxID=392734 RepID=A0A1H4RXV1_9BACT|nr:response regulator [Terriglobus roseus]SEC36401.1 Hpt domain-containing protein [Terriglobus roseus]
MRDGRSLLLIDDDETTRDLLSLMLGSEGWDVGTAASGDEALRNLSDTNAPPDVILSDLHMPGLCGSPMATAVRNSLSRQASQPLLIAMTATDRIGLPAGFDALLIKPFTPNDLRECCDALWKGKAPFVPKSVEAEPAEPSIAPAIFDRMKVAMPVAQLRNLYDFALSDAESRIIRMSAATANGDDAAYRREAHALKGSCGMVGAARLRTLAAKAEDEGLPASTVIQLNPLLDFHAELTAIRHMLESLLPSAS